MQDDQQKTVFRAWLEEHSGLMVRIARAYTATEADRQDLVQEILLQVWCSIPRFAGRAAASTWIYRVALNTALAWQRKDWRRRRRQTPLLEADEVPAEAAGPAGRAYDPEKVEQLYAAIRTLPKVDAALVLLYLDELSYREMAEVLGISESNVGVKLNRAKKLLADRMKEVTHG